MVGVLVVDDQPVVRQGFRIFLAQHPDIRVVGEAASGRAAVERERRLRPDVVLMDLRMPDGDGLWATSRILAAASDGDRRPRVVVMAESDGDRQMFRAVDAGASGFLLKSSTPEEVVAAVMTAADGGFALAPDMLPQLAAEFARRRYLGATPRAHALTERECHVVIAVAEGLSNVAIASRLGLESSTVKTHMSHIAKKTGCINRVQIAIWAYRHGIVGVDDSAPDLGAAHAEL